MVPPRCLFVEKEAESEGNRPLLMLSLRARLRCLGAQSSYRPRKHWIWAPKVGSGRRLYCFRSESVPSAAWDEVLFPALAICVGINHRIFCILVFVSRYMRHEEPWQRRLST